MASVAPAGSSTHAAAGVPAIVAGRGPEIDRLKSRLLALPDVEVIDSFIAPQDVVKLFQRSEISVLPYKDATQSAVAAGAFANGRLVVASRVGGLPQTA